MDYFGALAILLLGWLYFFKTEKDSLNRKQAFLLASGLTLPIIGGIIFEIIFPLIFRYNSMPVTTPLFTIFSITSLTAVKKYKMLELLPKHQWSKIIESMNEGVLIVDNEDRIHYANDFFCKLLGYEFYEIKGKIAKELFLDDNQKREIENIIESRKDKKSGQYEMPLKTKEGKIVWMLISGTPYLNRKGDVIGSIGVQTNITHIKEAEKIQAYTKARLNQAQEVARVGSWEVNFSTKKAIWSDEACKMYGFSPTEKNNQSFETWLSFIHPEDLDAVRTEVAQSQAALRNSSFQHRIILQDGSVKHIQSVSRFEFNDEGSPVGLFGICRDITEQIQARKSLVESEENMRTFINESLMSIYFVDPKTKAILYSNPALSDLLGYSNKELKKLTPYDFVNHSRENVNDRMEEVMKNKRVSNGERQWKRKDGKIVYVLVSSFYHKRNGTDAIYVAAQDITEQKMAEEKLKATNLDLKTFIYKASHDIRGPLASIMGLVNVSKLELKEEASFKYLDMINTATKKLDYTLGELVKAMTIKDVEIFSDSINFNEIVEDIFEKFLHFPGFRRVKITKDVVNVKFISNKSIISTIIQNLVENAVKYQRNNGVEPYVKITIGEFNNGLKILVEDNGIGIEKSIQPSIFDMYFRGNETVKGSGLGLYIVKKAIEKLNGSIDLQSQPGQGTTFTIVLPSH